jgi:hypothetical protein
MESAPKKMKAVIFNKNNNNTIEYKADLKDIPQPGPG